MHRREESRVSRCEWATSPRDISALVRGRAKQLSDDTKLVGTGKLTVIQQLEGAGGAGKQSINQDLARASSTKEPTKTGMDIQESKESPLGIEVGMSMKEAEKIQAASMENVRQ